MLDGLAKIDPWRPLGGPAQKTLGLTLEVGWGVYQSDKDSNKYAVLSTIL
jgi:hypothetical protein